MSASAETVATTIREVNDFVTADYGNMFIGDNAVDKFYSLFASPYVPFVSVTLYLLLSGTIFNFIRTTFNIQPKGTGLQLLTITHSGLLAVYSMWTCYNASKIALPYIAEHGLFATLCDTNHELWDDLGLGWWTTHFYISKYYEFLDTWIVLLKGREPMFLQTFHHAGVVIIMWACTMTKNVAGGGYVLVANSFIHSLMYTYYVFAAFGYTSPLKAYLTQAQIVQFLIGVGVTIPLHFMGCLTPASQLSMGVLQVYTFVLIYLFAQFYAKSYTRKKQ